MRRQRHLIAASVFILLMAAFAVVFIWGWWPASNQKSHGSSRPALELGSFHGVGFVISSSPGSKEYIAQFNPSIPADDTQVLGLLKELLRRTYGLSVSDETQPDVEVLKEVQYITFVSSGKRIIFKLATSQAGAVKGVRYWEE